MSEAKVPVQDPVYELNGVSFRIKRISPGDLHSSWVKYYREKCQHPNMMRGWLRDIAAEDSAWKNPTKILGCIAAAKEMGLSAEVAEIMETVLEQE